MGELRAVSESLYPPLLDESGLALALKAYANRVSAANGLDVQIALSKEFGRLQQYLELVVFLVTQAAVTNLLDRSGGASLNVNLDLAVTSASKTVTISIEGASPSRLAETQEMPNLISEEIRERLHQIGGTIRIDFGEVNALVVLTFVQRPSGR
jgi:signal transduction histidine kinase